MLGSPFETFEGGESSNVLKRISTLKAEVFEIKRSIVEKLDSLH